MLHHLIKLKLSTRKQLLASNIQPNVLSSFSNMLVDIFKGNLLSFNASKCQLNICCRCIVFRNILFGTKEAVTNLQNQKLQIIAQEGLILLFHIILRLNLILPHTHTHPTPFQSF